MSSTLRRVLKAMLIPFRFRLRRKLRQVDGVIAAGRLFR